MKLYASVLALLLYAGIGRAALADEQKLPEFIASYDVLRKGVVIARMQRSVSRQEDGNYLYRSETNVTGVVSIFRNDRILEQSTWQLIEGKLVPRHYQYLHTGTKKQRNVTIEFDWAKNQITNSVNGESWHMPAVEGIMDKLQYQYSIMLDLQKGNTSLSYKVADGGKEKLYKFESLGEETIDTPLGKLMTIKMVRHFADGDRQSIFWSAPDLGYLPVKLENVDDGDKTTITINSLSGYEPSKAALK